MAVQPIPGSHHLGSFQVEPARERGDHEAVIVAAPVPPRPPVACDGLTGTASSRATAAVIASSPDSADWVRPSIPTSSSVTAAAGTCSPASTPAPATSTAMIPVTFSSTTLTVNQ
jgi:hypothetical protein